ncbi:hypothetical protein ACIA5G_45870 [Amycolatopsis sp. NPDC051758]|uniref:hypothetical protein n=1 Tax=Amycolatopsis sp. NPDC051758 TaxID=3363935 RepID=UPI0037B7584F
MANADLRERELIRLAHLPAAVADGLRRRGVGDINAGLAAETASAVYRVAFQRWVDDAVDPSFAQLRKLTAAG